MANESESVDEVCVLGVDDLETLLRTEEYSDVELSWLEPLVVSVDVTGVEVMLDEDEDIDVGVGVVDDVEIETPLMLIVLLGEGTVLGVTSILSSLMISAALHCS